MAREDLLTRTFVELADTLVDDFDLVDLAQTLVERCVELFDASAAGLLLAVPGDDLRVLASSSEQLRVVELFELQASEGPCLDCYRTGKAVVNQDLAVADGRWPRFAPVALDAGFCSVHALPVRLRGNLVGALNLFRVVAGPLAEADIKAAQALSDAAAIAILQQRALTDARLLATQLQTALTARIVIEQAKGMVAQYQGITVDEAFARLRRHARSHNALLTDACHDVVDGRLALGTITAPASR
jgi:GAF domain-containing protein